MITEEQKDKMGEILFVMIAVAMKEVNHHMAFPAWQVVDKETRASYMNVVDQLLSIAEVKTPVMTEVKEVAVEKSEAGFISHSSGGSGASLPGVSSLLDTIINSDPEHPVTISRPPPEEEKKQKVAKRMAKARAVLREQKERRLAVA